MHLMETPIIQTGETIQIFLGNQDHLHTNHKPKPNKVMNDFVGEQKAINSQLHQKIENVESSQIKRMKGMQNDLYQKIDNIQYSISRLTNLNTVNEKGKFPSQPSQNPKGLVHGQERVTCDKECIPHRARTHVEKALLDLGASVNLLPYSVYKKLGLGGLKPTTITLSLADRSVKIPRGVIEDVLVQVDKFYYPVDFVVLDTDPTVKEANYVPIILGRPFLATSNAIINCRNGRHLHPEEEEGLEEVCLINTLVEEHCDKNLEENLNESLRVLDEGLPEPSDELAIMSPWRRREEILPLFNKEDSQGVAREDPPKLVLKPLLVDLNANFIWDPGKLSQDQIF
ncbi:hypothetical protein AAG906_004675 [Vitis piasezkii]